MKKIGVLIVEDSAVVRQLLEHIIGSDARFQILATVASAEEALEVLPRVSPDVISLDIRLPGMDGLDATRRIMREQPTPIVVCSASVDSDELSITMNALRAGALAVVEKPVGTSRADYDGIARALCTQLAIMSDVRVVRQRAFTETTPASRARTIDFGSVPKRRSSTACLDEAASAASDWRSRGGRRGIVGIGASTGGPPAVVQLLTDLGRDFPLPVLVVQHIIPSFLPGFVSWLDGVIPGRAVIAREGDVPMPGTVYLPPPDHHIEMDSNRIRLTQAPALSMQRPSATVMFQSIARSAGSAGLGVLLTGMGDDGADGLVELRRQGGHTIAEHYSTAVVYGMPKAAVDRGGATESLPLRDIGPRVCALVRAGQEVRA